jgi:probable rRNA maturation factor
VVDVAIDLGGFPRVPASVLERAVRHTLRAEGVEEGEVSVALLDDSAIHALNRDHLGHDGPTDVLAFALHGAGEPLLGDLYLGATQARRQAAEEGVDEVEELVRLAVHGTLHILGWDHPQEGDARKVCPMWVRQETLVAEMMRQG